MSSYRLCLGALIVALTTACSAQLQLEAPRDAVAGPPALVPAEGHRLITSHLEFLASDELGGRNTGTIHLDITARYVEAVFRAAGLEPAGDEGSFLQTYPLLRTRLDVEQTSLVLRGGGEERRPEVAEAFAVRGYGAVGLDVTAGVVFCGYGIVHEESGTDHFAGADLEGAVVVVLDGAPDDRDEFQAVRSWRAKQEAARERGARALVIVDDSEGPRSSLGWSVRLMRRSAMTLGGDMLEEDAFPRLYVRPSVAHDLFALAGRDGQAAFEAAVEASVGDARVAPLVLDGVELSLTAPVEAEELSAANVAGLLRGSDPELRDEVLVLSAHMDHIGIEDDGAVNNGADDNASGTAVVMAAAQALAATRAPGRSVLFLAVSGEEKGLLGSEWWVKHPTLDLERVVANVNIDMVGRNDPYSVGATPSPDHEEYNSLVVKATELAPLADLELTWTAGEGRFRRPVDSYYYRSDHVNFSDAGIPVVFFFSGEHEDYHRPSDTLDKVDAQKVTRVLDLTVRLLREVGDDPRRPGPIE